MESGPPPAAPLAETKDERRERQWKEKMESHLMRQKAEKKQFKP